MPRKCQLTQTRPQAGNNVSHSRRHTKRRFLPNIIGKKRYWVPSLKKFITLKISAKAVRLIDKIGIEAALARMKTNLEN